MADESVVVSGITPAYSGNDWFLLDEDGDFTIDKAIIAKVWLVGGGSDGVAGKWNGNDVDSDYKPIADTGTDTSHSGAGGDGGYIFQYSDLAIPSNQTITVKVAKRNNKNQTSIKIGEKSYLVDIENSFLAKGGAGGSLPLPSAGEQYAEQDSAVLAETGQDGILTPYGYVGSSGGGGAVCNGMSNATNGVKGGEGAGSGTEHRSAGTDATNYGCGGGGGAICGTVAKGQAGGKGKQGCVIFQYTIDNTGGDSGNTGEDPDSGGDSGNTGEDPDSGGGNTGEDPDSGSGGGSTTEPEKTLIVQKHYKRVCNTHKTSNTDYYSNNSSHHSCCSGGCSCGNANTPTYTDTLYIGSTSGLQNQISELNTKIQDMETENLELKSKIDELQSKIDSI